MTWIMFYGGLGYAFGSQWEIINQFVSDYSSWLGGMIVLGIGAYFLIRRHPQKY